MRILYQRLFAVHLTILTGRKPLHFPEFPDKRADIDVADRLHDALHAFVRFAQQALDLVHP